MRARVLSVFAAVAACAAVVAPAIRAAAVAPDGPGAPSYFDLARKDCVGTARDSTSKVWFTVAGGVLSDVYWPTVDATNVHTLQYLVTDGHRFTDLQTRDMTYTSSASRSGMACTVVARSASHGYRITTTYIADPSRDAVLMRVRFEGPRADRLYVRLDPLAGGTGGGGTQNSGGNTAHLASVGGGPVPVASNTNTTTNAANRDYAVPTFEALRASTGFAAASVGYAGTDSDGLAMLDAGHALTGAYTDAERRPRRADRRPQPAPQRQPHPGPRLRHEPGPGPRHRRRLGIGALQPRPGRLRARVASLRCTPAAPAPHGSPAGEYYRSVNVVKASEDKTFPGAIAAGLASPWGQSVPAGNATDGQPTYFGSYREVFARDLYEAFTGLLRRRRHRHRTGGDAVPVRPPAAGRRLDAAQLTAQRQGGARHRWTPARRDLLPDPHGLAVGSGRRRRPVRTPRDPRGRLPRRPRPVGRRRALGGAVRLLAVDDRRRDRRPDRRVARSRRVNGDPARARLYQATADDFARNDQGAGP